jgi:hypothetical protein
MASIWKIDGVDIYVDTYGESEEPQIAELNPINSTISTYHWIYTPDKTIDVAGLVIGSGNLTLIENTAASVVTLTTDLGNVTVLVRNVKADRQPIQCQKIDLTQATTAPVYKVTIALRT